MNWLALGDKKTRFSHQNMNAHRVRNTILSLVNDQGVRLEDPSDIEAEILGYYQGLLGIEFRQKRDATVELSAAIQHKVPVELREGLVTPISPDEIWRALKSIHRDKAPGPDDFNSTFFHDNWALVKEDFMAGVLYFFEVGVMPRGWNSTEVTLVPKFAAPNSIKGYRPNACCNTVYKCITKILANRLQSVLPKIIGPTQSALIKGRSIMDNILPMQELVRGYHRDQGPARCAIKLDVMKAYDTVDWDFLFEVMQCMEFPFMGQISKLLQQLIVS